jgi:anti-sigma regulatory factor (Ser/Thr protein kinase)
MTSPLFTVAIRYEHDVVLARQRARHITALLGFDAQEQARVATAVSELARNAFQYADAGRVEFFVEGKTTPQLFRVKVTDSGSGIANLQEILDGQYHSKTGMGLGIIGARRLVDQFHIESARIGHNCLAYQTLSKGSPDASAGCSRGPLGPFGASAA